MTGPRRHRFTLLRGLLLAFALLAVPQVVSAQLTITETTSPTLGTLVGGPSGRNFILNTDGTVSGTSSADYFCCAVTGVIQIKKTGGPQSANIVAENITTSGGVSVNSVPCKFDTGSQTTCNGAGINVTVQGNKNLSVGVNINTTQTHSGGNSASVSYDIRVTLL